MTARSSGLLIAAALGLLALRPRESAAQWAVGLDGGGVKRRGIDGFGASVDGRFGYRFGLPRAFIIHSIIFQVEAIGGYLRLLTPADGVNVERLGGGGRVGALLGYFEPFGFGHLSVADADDDWGSLWDVGVAADWRLPTSSLGAHWTHYWLHISSDTVQFNELGLHLEIRWY